MAAWRDSVYRRQMGTGATNKLVAKHVFNKFKCASPFQICSAFGSIGNEIGKHGELKELETAIMGAYRQRVRDIKLDAEGVNPKTRAGKRLLSKFRRAQTMQDLANALSATGTSPEDLEKWMPLAIQMKLKLGFPEKETKHRKPDDDDDDDRDGNGDDNGDDDDDDDEQTEMDCIVLFFEKLLRCIFQEIDISTGLSRIDELSNDATLDATIGLVTAVSNAVSVIDGKMIMGAIVSTLNSFLRQKAATLDSVQPYLAIDGATGDVD